MQNNREVPLTKRQRRYKIRKIERYDEIISAENKEAIVALIISILVVALYLSGKQLANQPIDYETSSALKVLFKDTCEYIKSMPLIDATFRVAGGISFLVAIANYVLASVNSRKKEDLEDEIQYDDELRKDLGLGSSEDFGKGL